MSVRVPSIPSVPSGLDAQTTAFLRAIKEVLETRGGTRRGSDDARYVTVGELTDGLGVDVTTSTVI